MEWDWIISVVIIVGLIFAIWAKVTHRTIGEILEEIKDFVSGTKEEIEEQGEEIIYYE